MGSVRSWYIFGKIRINFWILWEGVFYFVAKFFSATKFGACCFQRRWKIRKYEGRKTKFSQSWNWIGINWSFEILDKISIEKFRFINRVAQIWEKKMEVSIESNQWKTEKDIIFKETIQREKTQSRFEMREMIFKPQVLF